MRKKIIKKLKTTSGESLVETLSAILIISLTFAFLCNTIVSANKMNSTTRAKHPEMSYDNANGAVCQINISSDKNGGNDTARHLADTVTVYQDNTGNYLYY